MNADSILIPYFAEVIVGDKPEKIQTLQFSALRQLQARLRYYADRGYSDKLINAIAETSAGIGILPKTSNYCIDLLG